MLPRPALALALLALSVPAAAEIPDARVVLEVFEPLLPGRMPEAAPARFVWKEDGTVFVGGSSGLASVRPDGDDLKPIDKLVSRVKKLPGLGSAVTLGPGARRYRLALRKGPTITASGDPAQAPAPLKPLGELLALLESFDHPELRAFHPQQFALLVQPIQPGTLAGGCRSWTFGAPPTPGQARVVPTASASDWPNGRNAASACLGDKTYLVGLRPLLPGEKP
jgi:hypothetical protein